MELSVTQLTYGPEHHFFGYIGHARTIPWNGTGRYILCLRTTFQDHMPGPGETADVCLIDTEDDGRVLQVDRSLGWNPQQGTMFYWNPHKPDTQFFFNDRDPKTGDVFTVLYDVEDSDRVREYRYDTSFGNSGVAQNGGSFLGLNYARMARLRKVTGYVGASDWTEGVDHPDNDGVHRVNVETGAHLVVASFAQIADALRDMGSQEVPALFINHTLWNRDDDRIYFYARGGWSGNPGSKVNQPFTVDPDGSNLTPQSVFIGGHPEWEHGHRLIGGRDGKLVIYDSEAQAIVGQIADEEIIPKPGGDSALSSDGTHIVTGYGFDGHNQWVIYRLADSEWARTGRFDQRPYVSGDLRSDPAPCWNRNGDRILIPSLTADGTRQLHVITIEE